MGISIEFLFVVLTATVVHNSSAAALARRNARDRPNIILMFMDDLGYGDLGFTGHPTTHTPNIDKLAWSGKVLTSWYSGCSVCTGSRAALMTGRQWTRTGVPGVFGPTEQKGLNLDEVTIAQQLKSGGYATAIMGKWHLGQRQVFLPANRGFDYYLGIPYSDDMGDAYSSNCTSSAADGKSAAEDWNKQNNSAPPRDSWGARQSYEEAGYYFSSDETFGHDPPDPAGRYLPLVYQDENGTTILEQPLDFTHLASKYNTFATEFIQNHKDQPFFLYLPFSHVHTTSATQPNKQYAGCDFKNSSSRGPFGDALAESDWIIGNVVDTLNEHGIAENTLILFSSDNGPWLIQGLSGGSAGLLTGRYAGYWNTGKATTWEGGIREPAFAYWKGTIEPMTRSSEIVSSLDVFPTLSALAGVSLPKDIVLDGRDMSDILLHGGKSRHDFLFFYGTCMPGPHPGPVALRHGKYKAHWCTSPGLGGNRNLTKIYKPYPLLFDIEQDPSEAEPISTGKMPIDPDDAAAIERIMKAYTMERATFSYGTLVTPPDGPNEHGPGTYGVCCDRSKDCICNEPTIVAAPSVGFLGIGTRGHHDWYHKVSGEEPPLSASELDQVWK